MNLAAAYVFFLITAGSWLTLPAVILIYLVWKEER